MSGQREPKYVKIKNQLIKILQEGHYQKGQRLPTESQLMEEFSVSRTTVRQAVGELEEAGIVHRRHGSGTYFRDFNGKKDDYAGGLVGLINFYFSDYIYPDIIRGIENTLDKAGFSLALANSRNGLEREVSSVQRLLERGLKGLILEPSRHLQMQDDHPLLNILDNAGIPVVTTHWGIADKKVSTVTLDDIQAGYDAASYLQNKGHKDIAIIYKEDIQAGYDRYTGYAKAMNEAGVPIRPELVKIYDDNSEIVDVRQGYLLTQALLASNFPPPTAIFYFNDNTAAQGYTAIQEAGMSIPGDISVIGFDNHRNSNLMYPPLTTFEHPKYDLGKWAAKILLEEMDGHHPKMPMKLVFEPVLVERDSVKDIR